MGDPDKIKQLYSTVSKDYDVGTYEDFSAKLQDSAKRKSFYDFASKNYDLGDYASFEGKVVKKKVGTNVSPAGSSGTTQPISAQKEADIRSYLSATPEQKNANAKGIVVAEKPITVVKEKHLPSPKETDAEAVRRLTSPLAKMEKIKKAEQIPGMNMGDDFLGDELSKLSKEQNDIIAGKITDPQSIGDKTVNEEVAIRGKQAELLKDNAFQTGKDAGNYLQYIENKNQKEGAVDLNQLPLEEVAKRLPNTITAKSAFSKYQDRRKVTDALSDTDNLIDAAFNYAGIKDLKNVSNAKRGYLVDQFLNNKDVQELIQENPQLYGKYKEAQVNAMTQFPSYAMKSINQKVGQYIQDTDKDVWDALGKNIKDEKLTEVVDEMVAKGEMDEMEKSFFLKNKDNAKSWLEYADPKIDQSLNRSSGEGWRGWEKSVRSIGNKLWLTDLGLLEPIENTDRRMEEIEYSTPNIQPKGTFGKVKKGISEFTGQMLPMMLTAGLMRGAGSGATAAEVFPVIMQFGGENERKAREHFKDDKVSQLQYTIAQTSIDAMLGRLLPHGKIANNLRSELRKDVVTAIEQLSAGNIEKAAVKEKLIGAIGNKLKDIAKQNISTANIVTGFQIAHNGIDAAFGKRDFKLEDEAKDAFDTWKHSFVSATGLSALASKTGFTQRRRDRETAKDFIYELAKNPEEAAAKIKEQAELNPEAVKDVEHRLQNLEYASNVLKDAVRETPMDEAKQKTFLLNALNEKVLRDKAEATTDPTIKKRLDEQVKKSEVIKEQILDGKEVDALPQDDKLTAKEYKEVSEIKNDQELFDYFVKKSTKGYASTLNAALEMENKDEGRREGLKYMEDKAIENPKKFREDFGDALTEKMLDRVETKRLEESLDNLLEINSDDPSIPILDKLIEKRYENEKPKEESSITVIKPGEIKQPTETITIKPKEDAVPQRSANEVDVQEQATDGKGVGEGNARPEVVAEKNKGQSEEEKLRLSHATTEKLYKESGAPERLETPTQSREVLDAKARKMIDEGYDFDKKAKGVMEGTEKFEAEDQAAFDIRATELKNKQKGLKVTDPEFDKLQNEIETLSRAADVAGTVMGRALQSRRSYEPVEETISDYITIEKDVTGQNELTTKQKEQVQKEYTEISETEKALQQKVAALEAENIKLKAEAEVKKAASSKSKEKKDFKKEREDIRASIKDKWKKAATDGTLTAVPIPYAKQLAAISGDVAKLMKSYAEEGIVKLDEMIKVLHKDLKDVIPEITDKDVRDLIAGNYNEKKGTRNDLAAKLRDLRVEADLINRYEKLKNGEQPKNEKDKQKRNKEIADLQQKIKQHDLTKLDAVKKRTQLEIERIQEQLKSGDFAKEEPKAKLKLDKEATDLRDKLIKLKEERAIRILKEEYSKKSKLEKAGRWGASLLNVGRVLKSSFDVSMPFRQGLWGLTRELLSNPIKKKDGQIQILPQQRQLAAQFWKMYASMASGKLFRRYMADIKESPRYELAEKSGLNMADPNSKLAEAREESFGPSIADNIPLLGSKLPTIKDGSVKMIDSKFSGPLKASEQAATMFVNQMKWDIFNDFVDVLEKTGKTFENSPDAYKEAAYYANQAVGRGRLGEKVEKANIITSKLFFSLRLYASRVQLMSKLANPHFYAKVPKEIRIEYAKDLIKFLALGGTVLAIAKSQGAEVEDDPRSSDFGKVKQGDTRYDIWGGFSQYMTLVSRIVSGSTKQGQTVRDFGERKAPKNAWDVTKKFVRGKASPEADLGIKLLEGKDYFGNPITKGQVLKDYVTPLMYSDLKQALEDKSVQSSVIDAVLIAHGLGVQKYNSDKKK